MLVVLLLLPISFAVDNGEFNHCGGGGGSGGPVAAVAARWQRQRRRGRRWTTIGAKSGWQ
jgi:hypothetical protein